MTVERRRWDVFIKDKIIFLLKIQKNKKKTHFIPLLKKSNFYDILSCSFHYENKQMFYFATTSISMAKVSAAIPY